MILRVVGRPRPEPPGLVEKNASKIWLAVFSSMPQPVSIRSSATPRGRGFGADDQLPAVGHGLLGVEHQVDQRAVKRLAVQQHAGQVGIEVADDLDVRLVRLGARRSRAPAATCAFRSEASSRTRADLGEVQKVVEQVLQPLALVLHHRDLGQRPGGRGASRPRRNPRPTAPCSGGSSRADS